MSHAPLTYTYELNKKLAAAGGVPLITSALTSFLQQNRNETSTRPKAYINWIFLDENFRYVAEGSSFDRVGEANVVKSHSIVGIPVSKSGYLYVYASNESPVSVFFDNVQVVHTRDHILEETHYYPFGLTMAGISGKAVSSLENKKGYNGNELQSKEFSDGSGLEVYDFSARSYDQQLGRFIQVDPKSEESDQESWSPYHFGYNNPIRYNDPDGELPVPIIGAIVGAVTDIAVQSIEIALDDNKSFSKDFSYASVGVSALAGATGAGLATKVGKLGTFAKLAVEATHDFAASAANQYAKDKNVNLKQAAVDATIGKAIGDLAGHLVSKAASKTHGAKVLSNQLDRVKRIAENNPRSSRTAKVNDAQKKLDNYVARRATAASVSSSNVGSNVANKILGADDDKKKK